MTEAVVEMVAAVAGLIMSFTFLYVFWLLIRWLRATVINAEKRNKGL